MGLMDNIRSGIGSLASEVSPRNTAADMAMIEYNDELRKDNAARWAQAHNTAQQEFGKEIDLLRMDLENGIVPENFKDEEDLRSYLEDIDRNVGVGRQMGRLSYSQIKRGFGQEAANRFLNASGFAPSYFGEFGGSGKRLDEVNSISAMGTGEYEGQSGMNPTVRTVQIGQNGQSPQLYSANATHGGVPVAQLAAQGGDAAVDQESIGFIDDKTIDRMVEDYHGELDKRAGLRSDIRGLRDSRIPWDKDREQKDIAAAELAAEQAGTRADLAQEQYERGAKKGLELIEQPPGVGGGDPKEPTTISDMAREEGKGFTVQYKGKDERTLLMGDALFDALPSTKVEGGGVNVKPISYVEHNSASNAWTKNYLWDERVNPFNLTNKQWNSLSPLQQDKVRNTARLQTKQTLEDKQRNANRLFESQLKTARTTQGLNKAEVDEVAQVKAWYAKDGAGTKRHTDEFWIENPDKFEAYIKDPLGYGKANYNNKNELADKDPAGAAAASDAVPGGVTPKSKVIKGFTQAAYDGNMAKAKEIVMGLKEASTEANANLAKLIADKASRKEKWEKDQRAQLGLNFLAATRDDADLMRVVLGAIPTFMETGDFSTFQEELQLSYDQLKVKQETNRISRMRLQNDIQQQAKIDLISPEFQSDFSDRAWTILNDTELEMGPKEIGVIGGLFENQITVITNKMNAALLRGVNPMSGQLNAQTEYEQANAELDSAMSITMQALDAFITAQADPQFFWDELLTLGFATSEGGSAFDVNPNIVPVDKNGDPTSDINAFANGGGFMQLNPSGHLVGLTGGKRALANSKLGRTLGNKGLKLLFGVAVPNYYKHYDPDGKKK